VVSRIRVVVGGDPAYAGRFTHNPFHPDFERWGDGREWQLGDLFTALGTHVWTARTSRQANVDVAALGRNCSHFENVRVSAYAIVERYRRGDDRAGFQARVLELVRAENMVGAVPLGDREVAGIARSIAGWTWACYRTGASARRAHAAAMARSRAEFSRKALRPVQRRAGYVSRALDRPRSRRNSDGRAVGSSTLSQVCKVPPLSALPTKVSMRPLNWAGAAFFGQQVRPVGRRALQAERRERDLSPFRRSPLTLCIAAKAEDESDTTHGLDAERVHGRSERPRVLRP
jgi:hypothetical protein